jgi:glycerol-3-phosphate dehydrogenase
VAEEIFRVLYEGKSPADGMRDLLNRAVEEE